MKNVKSFIGFAFAGLFVMSSVWSTFGEGGIFYAFIGGTIIITSLWFLNHYWDLIHNHESAAFVDMAMAIGIAGIVRDTLLKGTHELVVSLPTLFFVLLGGTLAGFTAYFIEKFDQKEAKK